MDGPVTSSVDHSRSVVTVQNTRIGHFTLLDQLGSGGMGSVFAAYDEKLDRRVALKLVHSKRNSDSNIRNQRTIQEARSVARISHQNVISVHEIGETNGSVYIAMEYVDGGTLHDWQQCGVHSWQEVLDMYLRAGAGLYAAHGCGSHPAQQSLVELESAAAT